MEYLAPLRLRVHLAQGTTVPLNSVMLDTFEKWRLVEVKRLIIADYVCEDFLSGRQDVHHIKFSANSIEIQFP